MILTGMLSVTCIFVPTECHILLSLSKLDLNHCVKKTVFLIFFYQWALFLQHLKVNKYLKKILGH